MSTETVPDGLPGLPNANITLLATAYAALTRAADAIDGIEYDRDTSIEAVAQLDLARACIRSVLDAQRAGAP